MNKRDKLEEINRYDLRAENWLNKDDIFSKDIIHPVSLCISEPYEAYNSLIRNNVLQEWRILEIGAGAGENTKVLLDTGAEVFASDLSIKSLEVIRKRFGNYINLNIWEADIERLPFEDDSFDIVCSAGSLSYGAPNLVDTNILRVLKKGGSLIIIDSLNHNPIYKLNRYYHYLRGRRTLGTLKNMPDLSRIERLGAMFDETQTLFFGSITFLTPLLAYIFGNRVAYSFSRYADRLLRVQKSAFKFVLYAKGLKK